MFASVSTLVSTLECRDMAPFKQMALPAHLKHPGGRPSEYRPEYCQAVIDCMAQGFSLTAFAGSIRVAKDTVYEWIKTHPQFSDAVSRARAASGTQAAVLTQGSGNVSCDLRPAQC